MKNKNIKSSIGITMMKRYPQFTCPICGKGFEQKSRLERHIETSHPPRAPSAADVEKVLAGIDFPKSKQDLVIYSTQKAFTVREDILDLIKSLPDRMYRDAAEVAKAIGELKSKKKIRSVGRQLILSQPSKIGGKHALESPLISAARVARALKGIDFPKSKRGIIMYVRKHAESTDEGTVSVLKKISDRKYRSMAELEKEIGNVKRTKEQS